MMKAGVVMTVVVVVVLMMEAEASREVRQTPRKCNPDQPCTPLRTCKRFQALLRRPTAGLLVNIQAAVCNRDRRNVKVCCPGAIAIGLPINTTVDGESLLPKSCGRPGSVSSRNPGSLPASFSRRRRAVPFPNRGVPDKFLPGFGPDGPGGINPVAGGVDVELTQPFPWMAVLGYNSRSKPIWACGGSLITNQYVITAAHCLHNDFTLGLKLEVIRLGELNLGTEQDCADNGIRRVCAPLPQDFTPAQIIMHPDFNKRTRVSDDIALIRLDRKAALGQFVSPICLPAAGLSVQDLIGTRFVEVAGWGLNETHGLSAQHLQRASLPYFDKDKCNPIYDNTLVPEQICFGGGDRDSCQGDSGGPIFIRRNLAATLVGLVSRGLDFRCAAEGVPAVYTDVTPYRSWIISNIKP